MRRIDMFSYKKSCHCTNVKWPFFACQAPKFGFSDAAEMRPWKGGAPGNTRNPADAGAFNGLKYAPCNAATMRFHSTTACVVAAIQRLHCDIILRIY
ncbi:hypothetical protein Bxe_C1165 [Paraburkholderia xenovorans LB400]|uniref:Uncharacterized protein n=1 Tax=Paraburkholderia xenovorans (strain LB400) TaxID=266265 RepID=Q13FW0_PARXL|nr:hypothetical protein Bxe_C1165 [Paraburkholderia xenovorans LB400]